MISLQNICLCVIAQEFEMFYTALTTSNNEDLNQKFKFLQKVYSSELASELFRERKLKQKYLDILLNDHLKYLNGRWFEDSLKYRRDSIKDVICRLPNLTKVFLRQYCTDEILMKIVEFCPKIVEIDASFSFVTDIGVKQLCKKENGKVICSKIRKVSLPFQRITEEGVKCLIQNLPSLEKINHEDVPGSLYSLHKDDLHNLEKLPSYNLVYLELSESDLPSYMDLIKICVKVCPKLKSLKFFISDETQLNLLKSTSLKKLYLRRWKSNQKMNISCFLKNFGCNLISLEVSNCIISINVLAASCPKLRHLNLLESDILVDPDGSQCVFHCLTRCDFDSTEDNSITSKAINQLLLSSPKLQILTFRFCSLYLDTKLHILKCCENNGLKYIDFHHTPIEIKYVKDILLICKCLKFFRVPCSVFEDPEFTEFFETLPNKPAIYTDYDLIHLNEELLDNCY